MSVELVRAEFKIFILIILLKTVLNDLYTNIDHSIMIDVLGKNECRIFTDKSDIKAFLNKKYKVLSRKSIQFKFMECFKSTSTLLDNFLQYFIYPGTRWCGFGSKANNFSDLGVHKEEDKCCRSHDLCPNYIVPHKCKYNICNKSYFTCSHCDCDYKFLQCLKKLGTITANAIGIVYFNAIKMYCFRESPESPKCPIIYDTSSKENDCKVQIDHLTYEANITLNNLLPKINH